jgi:Electron transfer DM13
MRILFLLLFLAACTNTQTIVEESTGTLERMGAFYHVVHTGSGTAKLLRQPNGTYTIRLENFVTENGPLLEVYLSSAVKPTSSTSVSSSSNINLGVLKSTNGSQNYAVPANVDVAQYKSVVIWCKTFSVNFISAALE